MKPWLVHVLRMTGAALPVLAAALLLAMNSAGTYTPAPLSTPVPQGPTIGQTTVTPSPTATPTTTPTTTPTATPTAEPTEWIRTTVYVTASTVSVVAGQSITVTPQLVVTGTCGFPIMDITLNQNPPLFAYSDPMDNVVRGGAATWRLTAFAAGITTFTAVYFGETYCNGVWSWNYASGNSEPITVTGSIWGLPFAAKEPDR